MDKHLQTAVKRFTQEESNIAPISNTDANIIVEIGKVFDKLEQPTLQSIVKQWKSLYDKEVKDMLVNWNSNYEKGRKSKKLGSGKVEKTFCRKFIDFEGKMLDVFFIKTIEKDFRYDETFKCAYHCIVFNDGIEGLYQALTFNFGNEKLRDDAYENLKVLLEKTESIMFVN